MEDRFLHMQIYIQKKIAYGEVGFSNIWCNINSYKDFNQLHCHPHAKVIGGLLCQSS